eukprot:scaffold32541_cov129-Isochrysis_galbana.AAC.2
MMHRDRKCSSASATCRTTSAAEASESGPLDTMRSNTSPPVANSSTSTHLGAETSGGRASIAAAAWAEVRCGGGGVAMGGAGAHCNGVLKWSRRQQTFSCTPTPLSTLASCWKVRTDVPLRSSTLTATARPLGSTP